MISKWNDLGVDMITMIEESVALYIDKVRFRAVCTSWNSFPPKIRKQCPWLLHRVDENTEASHGLFNPLDNNVYLLNLPDSDNRKLFKGTSAGWVLTVLEDTCDVYLMNPLNGSRIELPQRNTFPDADEYDLTLFDGFTVIHKAVWTKSFLVFVIYGDCRKLAYCRPNDDEWTSFGEHGNISDIVFHDGKLHALTSDAKLLVLEGINVLDSKFSLFTTTPPVNRGRLVVSSKGRLMMVEEIIHQCGSVEIYSFTVYEHDPMNLSWNKFQNIGDIVFLGYNDATTISCLDVPECKGNRIYFTVIVNYFSLGIRVFDLDDKFKESLLCFELYDSSVSSPPIWI